VKPITPNATMPQSTSIHFSVSLMSPSNGTLAQRPPVHVVVASHPLAPNECAALELLLDDEVPVEQWELVSSGGVQHEGYTVEVGVACFGAPAVYDSAIDHFEIAAETFFKRPHPAWATADGGGAGTIVYCTVGPQHKLCRTWLGTTSDRPVAVVTDLGLLELDLVESPTRPWRS
jgi:hypothetical protein